jgi:iron complex transport system ATP-binding protein
VTIEGVEVEVSAEAVVVTARSPLTVVSSAVVGGGFTAARAIVNLHVPKNFPCAEPDGHLTAFVGRRGIPQPYVGLLTSAWTEKAEQVTHAANGITALAVATVGLGNPVAAGRSPLAAWQPSTINTIVVLDADPEPPAFVNAIITATEAKALALAEAGFRCADGVLASGTSTDAVVVAATGRGSRQRYGGPVSDLGWVVARAVKSVLDVGIRKWLEEHA